MSTILLPKPAANGYVSEAGITGGSYTPLAGNDPVAQGFYSYPASSADPGYANATITPFNSVDANGLKVSNYHDNGNGNLAIAPSGTISALASAVAGTVYRVVVVFSLQTGSSKNVYTTDATFTVAPPLLPPTDAPVITFSTAQNLITVGFSGDSSNGQVDANLFRGTESGAESATAYRTQTPNSTGGGTFGDGPPSAVIGTTYFYRANFSNGAGIGAFSNEVSGFIPAPPPAPPAPPAAPQFSHPTSASLQVTLPPLPLRATSLTLQRAPDAAGSPGTFASVPGGGNLAGGALVTDTGLSPGTAYWYRAVALGDGGSTAGASAPAMTTTPDTTAPTLLSGAVGAAGTSLLLTFSDPDSAGLLPAAPTGFSCTVNGSPASLGTGAVSDLVVTVPFTSSIILAGQNVLVSYAPGNLTDNSAEANPVAAFANRPAANNSTQIAPLSISLTAPASGASVQGIAAFTAQASGGTGGIRKVELYVAGSLVDSQTAGVNDVYTLRWDSTAAGNGTYTAFAKAYDNGAPQGNKTSASLTVNALNPDRLGTAYWFSGLEPPVPGAAIAQAVVTLDVKPASDSRAQRELFVGITTKPSSFDFEKDYTLLPLNTDFLLTPPAAQYRLAVKLSARYTVGAFAFTEGVGKMSPMDGKILLQSAAGKLYAFDGVSAPVLLLDTAPVLLAGETLKDACAFGGRLYLALSGGPAPLTSRVFVYDPAPGYESDSQVGLPGTASAIAATAAGVFVGTADGFVHKIGPTGRLQKLCGGTTPALPFGVSQIVPAALTANTAPGVAAILTDGSVWDVDGSALYGATEVFLPPDGAATAAGIADMTYLGSAGGGLYGRTPAGYALAYAFPHAVQALAGYGGTVYAGLGGDGRLWGKTLSPGQHALAFGPVTDPLGKTASLAGLTGVTALAVIGGGLYAGGTAGAGEATLYEYQAPPASALGVFGQAFRHPALEVRAFA